MNAITTNVIEVSTSVRANRKENKGFFKEIVLLALNPSAPEKYDRYWEHATIRLYQPADRVYACVWYHDRRTGKTGCAGASAGGGGYSRSSAAIDQALQKMHLLLSDTVEAKGPDAALEAIAEADGLTNYIIHTAHA